ncbi:hypothetical protein [Stenotrophobium rhamnosiphilum]|uniref:Uncharacterized protein n=1 Tax=Stenotrophobium rhamnosiphilum TaxID=2029166 RepID=A0A2T5MI60_9GAMM|nr:hypothetical protein [Stenotrophobium rhamnosiphilum]PTU32272.1 hypothetical protein CJD38_06365 [Stenotrophobium rhamnosiphilum]
MNRYLLLCIACISCTEVAESGLTAQSYGRIQFGQPLATAEKILDEKIVMAANSDPACHYVSFAAYPNVRFMVENGVVTRGELQAGQSLGVGIADSLESAKAKHPDVYIQPHKYDPNGHYLILKSSDAKFAVVMEEAGGKITKIRGGIEPSVEYVEGCL